MGSRQHVPREEIAALDAAYAAGLIEGEGYVVMSAGIPRLGINMCDVEPLEQMLRIFGGRLTGPKLPKGKPHYRPQYIWHLNGWNVVEAAFEVLHPYLSPRRTAQFERALKDAPPVDQRKQGWYQKTKTHCPRGHPYDESNTYVSKAGRRHCKICALAASERYRNRHRERRRKADAERQRERYWALRAQGVTRKEMRPR